MYDDDGGVQSWNEENKVHYVVVISRLWSEVVVHDSHSKGEHIIFFTKHLFSPQK